MSEERNKSMAVLYRNGWMLHDIGCKYGITRERVRQILKKQGLTRHDGGRAVKRQREAPERAEKAARIELERIQKKRERIKRIFGCSLELYEKLGGGGNKSIITRSFLNQRHVYQKNGTEWELSLKEWWDIWEESGRWEDRGTKKDCYQMARADKTKPFKVDNVRIVKAQDSKEKGAKKDD